MGKHTPNIDRQEKRRHSMRYYIIYRPNDTNYSIYMQGNTNYNNYEQNDKMYTPNTVCQHPSSLCWKVATDGASMTY